MEAYVDDMLVKTIKGSPHNLREAFECMRRQNVHLNPPKCAFGVKSGKFLGFMVSERGIEANPKKLKAIEEMKSPTCHKEV